MVLEIVWLGSCFVSDGAEGLAQLADEHVVEKRGRDPVLLQKAVQGPHFRRTHSQAAAKASQVWPPAQFYSVDFSPSRICG